MSKNSFDIILEKAIKFPGVKIDRREFLIEELSNYFPKNIVERAIIENPAMAGIEVDDMKVIAEKCIKEELFRTTLISTALGIPGGAAITGTILVDITQYFAHILRAVQKLAYLFGWSDMYDAEGNMKEDTMERLTLFMGVMFGVDLADNAVVKLAQSAALNVEKKILQRALTRSAFFPLTKKIASILGVRISEQNFSTGVTKVIPLVGGGISGIVTYVTFKPLVLNLKEALEELPLADTAFYKKKV